MECSTTVLQVWEYTVFTKWKVDPSMVEDFSVASLDVLKAVDNVGVDRRFNFKAT